MVNMAASPTPQSVGREFVRQYYTMLNQAPSHQHRFYSTDSSFVHGGSERKGGASDQPVYGQKDIHARITQLNFDDCKAKIRQVDSHSTLGDGVVVQVCGELSNRGMPLRRFMQTFVLAPQSPKKYYVINDIFRYQDEVFSDDENDDADADDEADVMSNNASSSFDNSGVAVPQQDSFNKAGANMTADVVLRRSAGQLSDAVAAENFKNVEMSANAAAAAAAAAVTAVTAATHQQAVKQLPGSQTGVGVGGDGITTVSITQQLAVESPPTPVGATTHPPRPATQLASNQQTTLSPKDVQVNGQPAPRSNEKSEQQQVTSPPREQQPPGQLLHQQLPDVAASAAARATVTAASPPQQQQQQQPPTPKPTPPKPDPKPAEPAVVAVAAPAMPEKEQKPAEKAAEPVSQSVPPSYATLVKSSGPPSGTGAIRAISPGSLPSAGFNKNPLGPSLSSGATGSTGSAGTPSAEPQVSSVGGGGGSTTVPASKDSFASAASGSVQGKTRPAYGGRGSAGSAAGGRPSSTAGGSVRGYSESRSRDEREDHSRMGDRPRDNRSMLGSMYPDSQQIFVGNLPHTVTEQDLNTLFGEYGEVVEIRISIKGVQQSKLQPAGQKVPNFGFVVFADDEAARKCLDDTPIKLPDGHRLNVETKKNKQNMREARLQNSESYHSDHRGPNAGSGAAGGGGPNGPPAGVKARLSSTSSNSGANNSFGGSQEQLGNARWSSGGRGGPRGGLGGSRGGGRGGFGSGGRGGGGSGGGSAPPPQGSSSGPSRGAYSGSRGRP